MPHKISSLGKTTIVRKCEKNIIIKKTFTPNEEPIKKIIKKSTKTHKIVVEKNKTSSKTSSKSSSKTSSKSTKQVINKKDNNTTSKSTSKTTEKDKEDYSWDMFMQDLDDEPDIAETVVNTHQYPTNTNIELSLERKVEFDEKEAVTECECGGKLQRKRDIVICQGCGIELNNNANVTEEQYSTSAMTECNVNDNGFIPVKMIGRGSFGYNKSMLKTCASYKKYRKVLTLKEMNNWNIHSKKQHIPKNVIKEANDIFMTIKDHGHVYRKDVKKGVLSACIYYACYNNGITKTPSEVAEFSGIEEKFHSFGDRILHDLNERGVINISEKINPIEHYVNRYMELLNIDKKYKPFVMDIINRADKNKIHILHDSKNNTKCVGTIYMLVERVPELRKTISKELIEKECGISKTTFIRYYQNALCKYYRKFKKSFKRHGIRMPSAWRDKK